MRQRIFEPRQAQVGAWERSARPLEHLRAGVDREERRTGVAGADAPGSFASANAEFEDGAGRDALGRRRGLVLQLFIGGDLGEHVGEIRLRIPVPLCHSTISMSAGHPLQVDLSKSSAQTSGSLRKREKTTVPRSRCL